MFRHFALFFTLTLLLVAENANSDMQCLVARAGFGLVSEHCPTHTVGCRIRIQRDAVTFYDYLDRNQFVCVLRGEVGEQRGSGCIRKRSGNIRCWCFGRSNCNTVDNSKLIYEAFAGGNEAKQKLREAIQRVDFVDLEEERTIGQGRGTDTVTSRTPKSKPNVPAVTIKEHVTTRTPSSPSTKSVHSFHRPHKEQKNTPPTVRKTSTTPRAMVPMQNSTMPSEYDQRSRVHVIHVSSRDQYEPVFGSAALRRIMAQEKERLKAESEAIAAEIQDDYEEEEEGTDDLASAAVLDDTDQPAADGDGAAPISRRVAQRSELAKPKGNRMEQREKGSSSGEQLENALGDEYFDSSFFAPASRSSCRPTFVQATLFLSFVAFGTLFLALIDQ